MADKQSFTYEEIEAVANTVLEKIPKPPVIAVICGKNTDTFPDTFEDKVDMAYEDVSLPPSHFADHSILTYGTLGSVPIITFRARWYMHKGSSVDRLVLPVRLSKLLGVKVLLLISSASCINEAYNPGDIMFLKDHINVLGIGNDKVATPDTRWGGGRRSLMYNELRKCAMDAASSGFSGQIHEGVYVCASMGKQQTVAEATMYKQLGGDVVGTSIAFETLAAVECGIDVVAFAIITAKVPLSYDSDIKLWEWESDTVQSVTGETVKGLTSCMKEKGMIEEEKPPEPPEEEKPPEPPAEETPPEETPEEATTELGREGPPPEGAEEEKPPQATAEGKSEEEAGEEPPAEEEKKPKKPCECKKKPSEVAPPPEQPPEEKKKKRSCECKDKKKAEGGAPSASKVPSSATPAGGASAAQVPSGAATPAGEASAAKVASAAATPGGGASAAQVASAAATPGGGASAAQVASAAATPGGGASAAQVASAAATPGGGASAAKVASAAETPADVASAAEVPSADPEEGAEQ